MIIMMIAVDSQLFISFSKCIVINIKILTIMLLQD